MVVERLSLRLFTLLTTASFATSPVAAQSTMGDVWPRLTPATGYGASLVGAPVRRVESDGLPDPSSARRVLLPDPRRSEPLDLGHHWKAAVVGATVMGLLGAVTADGLCHFDDPCRHPAPFVVGGFLLGAAAGMAIGVRIATWHGEEAISFGLTVDRWRISRRPVDRAARRPTGATGEMDR